MKRTLRRPGAESITSFGVVAGAVLFVVIALHPSKLLSSSTPAGGDMGAHVWAPDYMRHHLFHHFRLTGWSQDWYAGFPAFTFYFPLPYLVIAVLSFVLPYGVAFKLVSVAGLVGLPVAAWAFARLMRMRFPAPPLMALATVPYLFDRYWTIYGGNIASTLAGEFAFSISLALALIFLGTFSRSLETGRYRGLSAVLLAATALCHLLPTLFAAVGALVLFAISRPSWRRLVLSMTVALVGVAIAGFWLLPFALRLGYSNDMGWERTTTYLKGLFPFLTKHTADNPAVYTVHLKVVVALAAAGAAGALILRRKGALLLTGLGLASAAAFRFMPQSALWNARMLPFWYLSLYLIAAAGVAEGVIAVAVIFGHRSPNDPVVVPTSWGSSWAGDIADGDILEGEIVEDEALEGSDHVGALAQARSSHALLPPQGRRSEGAVVGPLGIRSPAGGSGEETADGDSGSNLPVLSPFLPESGERRAFDSGEISPAVVIPPGSRRPRPSGSGGPDGDEGDEIIPSRVPGVVATVLAALLVWTFVGRPVSEVPSWFGLHFGGALAGDRSYVRSWANWNYSGYEGKASYPEYRDVITTMANVGVHDGCGRAMWEYEAEEDRFGTPMALMLLPKWTNGCIGSMEGLYFESSATVPYHFLNQAELSAAGSDPMRGLPYSGIDIASGVAHLRLLGVRYYMAISPQAQAQARVTPGLALIARTSRPYNIDYTVAGATKAQSRQWEIYQVADSDTVAPLHEQPVVMTGAPTAGKGWQKLSVAWYQDQRRWDVPLAASGPKEWKRVKGADPNPPRVPVRPATVTNIRTTDDRISFDVDRPGSPVLVKTSYFPNWQATGARGPWRVTPNLMVVIPTSSHVELHYGFTPVDNAGRLLTVAGLAAAVFLWRRPGFTDLVRAEDGEASDESDAGRVADEGGAADGSEVDVVSDDWDTSAHRV